MKERPILFNAPMVRAVLAGTKTQTRRVVKLTEAGHVKEPGGHRRWHPGDPNASRACPYGQTGDRLWVRETFYVGVEGGPIYRACIDQGLANFVDAVRKRYGKKWVPSIHMPRWASRNTLEIVSVRVERLHDISRGDAMAEGCPFPNMAKGRDPREWYSELWESINGSASWAANPWVWVVEFKRVQP